MPAASDGHAAAELIVFVHEEVRKLAAARLASETPRQIL
jgi:hypothetical protein